MRIIVGTRMGGKLTFEFGQNVYEVDHRMVNSMQYTRQSPCGKKTEQALADGEARFATVFRASPIAIALAKIEDGKLYDVNPAWEQATGYSLGGSHRHTTVELGIWVHTDERGPDDQEWTGASRGRCAGMTSPRDGSPAKWVHSLMSSKTVCVGHDACLLTMAVV